MRSDVWSYWLIKQKYGVHISNSLQDIRQNHWTMKNRSQWPTFILRSNVESYWLIILKYDIHTANSLQDIRQNYWTMKYRSQRHAIIFRLNIGLYWLIIPRYGVHIYLVVLRLNVPVNNFSVMSGRSHRFLGN